ncbi:Hypp423 [Branchiostoma lanceolatum]|uniref:Hypp423 protein n=1 Tax=Branchiostoma lanceolatum TaxID=7740 RepID=A0A8J9V9J8_BRALA|nr:Hypp423 [Branchiostoma lanceolatum]
MPGSEALTKPLQDGLAKFFHFYSRLETEDLLNDQETGKTRREKPRVPKLAKVSKRDLEDEEVVIFDRTWYVDVIRPSGRDRVVDPLVMTLRPAGQTDVTGTRRRLRGMTACCSVLGWISTVSTCLTYILRHNIGH